MDPAARPHRRRPGSGARARRGRHARDHGIERLRRPCEHMASRSARDDACGRMAAALPARRGAARDRCGRSCRVLVRATDVRGNIGRLDRCRLWARGVDRDRSIRRGHGLGRGGDLSRRPPHPFRSGGVGGMARRDGGRAPARAPRRSATRATRGGSSQTGCLARARAGSPSARGSRRGTRAHRARAARHRGTQRHGRAGGS